MRRGRWSLRSRALRDPQRAIDKATSLADSGRAPEALALLTEANHIHRDPRIARALAQLRYEAAVMHQWPETSPPWPDKAVDDFPDQLIPEVHRDELDAQAVRSAIDNHGSLLVREFIDPSAVQQLVEDIDEAFDAFDAFDFEATSDDNGASDGGWYVPFDHPLVEKRHRKRSNGNILAIESPPALFDLIEVLRHAGMHDLAADYLREDPMLLARKLTLRRLPHEKTGGWHQDGAFMGKDIRSVNVWIALTPCGDDAPGLDIVARRFDDIVPTGTEGSRFAWSVSADVADDAAEGAIVSPRFDAGDAMIFDHLCLHKTGTKPGMTVDRYAIESWFFAPSTYRSMLESADTDQRVYDQVPLLL